MKTYDENDKRTMKGFADVANRCGEALRAYTGDEFDSVHDLDPRTVVDIIASMLITADNMGQNPITVVCKAMTYYMQATSVMEEISSKYSDHPDVFVELLKDVEGEIDAEGFKVFVVFDGESFEFEDEESEG